MYLVSTKISTFVPTSDDPAEENVTGIQRKRYKIVFCTCGTSKQAIVCCIQSLCCACSNSNFHDKRKLRIKFFRNRGKTNTTHEETFTKSPFNFLYILFVCLTGAWLAPCLLDYLLWFRGCVVPWLPGSVVAWFLGCLVLQLLGSLVDWCLG